MHKTEGAGIPSAIPRLTFTRTEATRVLRAGVASKNLQALGFDATKDLVLGGTLAQYRVVHFATHGYVDADRSGLSAIVLSLVDRTGKSRDGFLRTHELYNLDLPADLVVLSACETGLGRDVRGEGLVGLTRGFMYAGAARVVVSLCSVNDQATAELMGLLRRNAEERADAGRRVARGPDRGDETAGLAPSVLLGGIRARRRMEVTLDSRDRTRQAVSQLASFAETVT